MADAGKLELLFAHAEGTPFLSAAADAGSAAGQVETVAVETPEHLADKSANANLLDKQLWAVVIADNQDGERLRHVVDRLVARRSEDQGRETLILRVPPNMDHQAAMTWRKKSYPALYHQRERLRPRYLCILGDMDQVSMATQQVLAIDGFPGRLVCRDEHGYRAYVDKVLRWEQTPSSHQRPRSLFYTVNDHTAATRLGYQQLVRPCFEHCHEIWRTEPHEFPASRVEDRGSQDELDPDEFLELGKTREPTLLFSLSHGMGPPRRRLFTPEEARERQGSMVFGHEGAISPADVAEGPFLPGGLWFYFACFGAGTPSQSAYHHWMTMLAQAGMKGLGNLQALLRGLDRQGGFTSGLAQAALANPDGPLGLLGHVDLAWSYSYQELEVGDDRRLGAKNRASGYFELLTRLVKGERLGAAMLEWQDNLNRVSNELNTRYDACKQRGVDPEGAGEAERTALGNLWMRRQDMLGYAVLGDPAVRLPLANRHDRGTRRSREDFEKAILEYLLHDDLDLPGLAHELGIPESDARACARAYQDAGRKALDAVRRNRKLR